MPRLEDLIEDLRVLEGARCREALYDILRRGGPAAQAFAAAASDPVVLGKVVAALSAEPARALTALATAKPPMRKVLAPLVTALPDEVLLSAVWQVLAGVTEGNADLAAAVIELLEPRVADPSDAARLASARAANLARIMLGRAYLLLDDFPAALKWFAVATKGRRKDISSLPEPVVGSLFAWVALATDATGDWHTGLAIAEEIAGAGAQGSRIAGLLARGMLAQPARSASMIKGVLAAAEAAGGVAARRDLLAATWQAANDGLLARRSIRSGYFADQLSRVGRTVDDLARALADPLAEYGQGPSAEVLAAAAAATVGRLMQELVAFQALRPGFAEPRQLLLTVALADRDDLSERALDLRIGPAREPISLRLDDALVRGLIRAVLRGLADGTRGEATAVTVTARAQPDTDSGPQAVFEFAVAAPSGMAISRRALAAATVPDLLRRCLAHVEYRDEGLAKAGGDVAAGWTFRVVLPEMPAETPQATAETELAREMACLIARAACEENTTAGLAHSASRLFDLLAQSEIERWGRDLGLVLHDLKNSLAFIQGWLRGDSVWDQETVRTRCQENIDDMRFWLGEAGAILAAAEPAGHYQYVDLREMTSRVLRGLTAVMARRRQRLSLEMPPRVPRIPGSPAAVASVLRNLARNALNSMPEGGLLRVTVLHSEPDETVAVTFRDDGPGFAGALLAPGDRESAGDGITAPQLGLISVRRLLTEQGGALRLANDPISGGGVATADFSTGAGLDMLRGREAEWRTILPDARRALRAAHALSAVGDAGTARHLWQTAVGLEIAAMLKGRGVTAHSLLPRLPALATGSSSKPQLTPVARTALIGAFGQSTWPRAEATARRVLSRIAARQFDPADTGLAEAAVLVCLFDIIPASQSPAVLQAQLFSLSGELEGSGDTSEDLEARVLAVVISTARTRAELAASGTVD